MKGLLIKDFRLTKNQLLSILVFAVIFVLIPSSYAASGIGYMTIIGAMLPLSTISYDQFDNGEPFLFSLPITRKTYVVEKYLFGLTTGTAMCLSGTAIAILRQGRFEFATFAAAFSLLLVLFLLLSIMIPFQLKFGPEKSRYMTFGIVGLLAAAGFLFVKAAQFLKIDISGALNQLNIHPGLATGASGVFVIAVLHLSIKISINIMNRKDF